MDRNLAAELNEIISQLRLDLVELRGVEVQIQERMGRAGFLRGRIKSYKEQAEEIKYQLQNPNVTCGSIETEVIS